MITCYMQDVILHYDVVTVILLLSMEVVLNMLGISLISHPYLVLPPYLFISCDTCPLCKSLGLRGPMEWEFMTLLNSGKEDSVSRHPDLGPLTNPQNLATCWKKRELEFAIKPFFPSQGCLANFLDVESIWCWYYQLCLKWLSSWNSFLHFCKLFCSDFHVLNWLLLLLTLIWEMGTSQVTVRACRNGQLVLHISLSLL